jgi:hypothetical protein
LVPLAPSTIALLLIHGPTVCAGLQRTSLVAGDRSSRARADRRPAEFHRLPRAEAPPAAVRQAERRPIGRYRGVCVPPSVG